MYNGREIRIGLDKLPGKAGILGKVGKITKHQKGERTMIKRLALLLLHFVGSTDHRHRRRSSPAPDYELWRLVGWWSSNGSIYAQQKCERHGWGFSGQSQQHPNCSRHRSWRHCRLQLLRGKPTCLAKVFRVGSGLLMEPIQPSGSVTLRVLMEAITLYPSWSGASTPLGGDERFTRGRWVPFVMLGPAIVWSDSSFSKLGGNNASSTNVGIVTEIGLEYFIVPKFSIGPSSRYRHVFGPNYSVQGVKLDSNLDQFTVLGRLAYHF